MSFCIFIIVNKWHDNTKTWNCALSMRKMLHHFDFVLMLCCWWSEYFNPEFLDNQAQFLDKNKTEEFTYHFSKLMVLVAVNFPAIQAQISQAAGDKIKHSD